MVGGGKEGKKTNALVQERKKKKKKHQAHAVGVLWNSRWCRQKRGERKKKKGGAASSSRMGGGGGEKEGKLGMAYFPPLKGEKKGKKKKGRKTLM